jgi:hypothetical protein
MPVSRPVKSLATTNELAQLVNEQLPPGLRNRFTITVRSDAFMLAPRLTFRDQAGRTWETGLEEDFNLPDAFLSLLCLVE